MLAVTTLKDFGGLPRELTAVGSRIYFALDSGVDGHLSYVNLVEYNVKTGKQRSITKEGGKKFGQTQYYLSERDGALIIREKRSAESYESNYWRVAAGEVTAKPIDAPAIASETPAVEPLPVRPRAPSRQLTEVQSMSLLDANRYVFIARDAGKSRIFTCGLDGRNVKKLDVPVAPGAGDFRRFADVAVASGGRLVVTYDTRITHGYVLFTRGTASTTVHVPGTISALKFGVGLVAARHGRVLMEDASINASYLSSTDGTLEGTRELGRSYTQRTAWLGDKIVMAKTGLNYLVEDADPEAKGGYVAPGGSGSGVTQIASTYESKSASSYDFANDQFEEIGPLTDVALMQPMGTRLLLSGARAADDVGGINGNNSGYSESFLTDGTSAATIFAFKAWRLPVVAGGRVVFADSPLSSTLNIYSTAEGYVQGRVASNLATGGPGSEALVGVSLFLDRNSDGVRQDDELLTKTTDSGRYLFERVPAGEYTVRVADAPTRFAETQDAPVVRTKRASTRTVDLVVADRRKIYGVRGYVSGLNSTRQDAADAVGAIVYVDRNRNGSRDVGEAQQLVNAYGYFELNGLRAGSYKIGLELPAGDEFSLGGAKSSVGVVLSQHRLISQGNRAFLDEWYGKLAWTPAHRRVTFVFADAEWNNRIAVPGATAFIDDDRDGTLDEGEMSFLFPDPRNSQSNSYYGAVVAKRVSRGTHLLRVLVPKESGMLPRTQDVEFTVGDVNKTVRIYVRYA